MRALAAAALVVLAGCEGTSRSPSPLEYHWPDALSWRIEYLTETHGADSLLLRYAETKRMYLALRGDDRVLWYDSVLKTTQEPGGPIRLVGHGPEDTLGFYVDLGRRGEIGSVQAGCDPALPACAAALPSAVRLELRRFVPRLAIWPVPRGGGWSDTIVFDEIARPDGVRGQVVTRYRMDADTVLLGRGYWLIGWRSRRQVLATAAGPVTAPPADEAGATFVDKVTLVPVYAEWVGAAAAPAALRQAGATGTRYRGRVFLEGSVFDSVIAAGRTP